MVSVFKELLTYLAVLHVAASGATIITYFLVDFLGFEAERNPIMRFIFMRFGLVTGLILKHVYLTVIGLVIICIAVRYRFEALIWILIFTALLDSVFCMVGLLKFLSENFI